MSLEYRIRAGNRLLRCGVTTGSCAALAVSAAVRALLTGIRPETVSLMTPKGLRVEVRPEAWSVSENAASCAVRKDAGDDPDVTDGILIFARVQKTEHDITVEGGEGVGRVTKPGLDRPVGEAAINSVPLRMIREAAEVVCEEAGYSGGLSVVISAPGGEEIARRTFNPMLGITGGISILGTSGIVEPMSEQALIDTVALEASQIAASGREWLVLAPGSYALSFLQSGMEELRDLPTLKCSNFIGEAIDIVALEGFRRVLLVGHAGKLIKLAGGIMNTHSRMADCRMELLCAHAAVCGADQALCRALMEQVTVDAGLDLLADTGLLEPVTESLLCAIQRHLNRRAAGAFPIGAVMFTNARGLLGSTDGAKALLAERREER